MRRLAVLLALAPSSLAFGLGIGDAAPPIAVQVYVKGTPIELRRGIHVVELWSGADGPAESARIADLAAKYRGKADFAAVSVGEKGEEPLLRLKRLVLTTNAKTEYALAFDGEANATAAAWLSETRVNALPAAFLVKDGRVLWIGRPSQGLAGALDSIVAGTYDEVAEKAKYDGGTVLGAAEAEKAKRAEAEIATLMAPLMAAMQARDASAALTAIDAIEAKRPDLRKRFEPTRFSIYVGTSDPRTLDLAKRFAEADFKDDAETLNSLAWSLIDPKNGPESPNLPAALILAKRAVDASGMKDGQILDTYALALYKSGDRKRAVEFQTKAVALAKLDKTVSPETLRDMQDRLETFKKPIA